MDNASYYNVILEKLPTHSWRRDRILLGYKRIRLRSPRELSKMNYILQQPTDHYGRGEATLLILFSLLNR
jgi:hypothetical protein